MKPVLITLLSAIALALLLAAPAVLSSAAPVQQVDATPLYLPHIAGGLATPDPPTPTPTPTPRPLKIVFSSERNGVANLFIMQADGSEQTLLVASDLPDRSPRISPDQQTIAFERTAIERTDILLTDPSGRTPDNITGAHGDAGFAAPDWSRANAMLVFERNGPTWGGSFGRDIWLTKPDGTNARSLTSNEDTNFGPRWSPNGYSITFAGSNGGLDQYEVFVQYPSPDLPTLPINLTNSAEHEMNPVWSPDDGEIAFARYTVTLESSQICLIDYDGANLRCLTDGAARDEGPQYSPDGKTLLFHRTVVSGEVTSADLYLIDRDGTNLRALTHDDPVESRARWSPDGAQIAYCSDRTGDMEIYTMKADGSDVRQLTAVAGVDCDPVWLQESPPS